MYESDDDVQDVEQLALVFVDAFDLYVEDGFGVDADAEVFFDPRGKAAFVVVFDGHHGLLEVFVVRECVQLRELGEIGAPAGADVFVEEFGKAGVGKRYPAPWRDAVGDVGEGIRA